MFKIYSVTFKIFNNNLQRDVFEKCQTVWVIVQFLLFFQGFKINWFFITVFSTFRPILDTLHVKCEV